MSLGDSNKFSIPTTYQGIEMRSKLETKVAMFLDYLKIKWEYEPKLFLLSSGIKYKPDFFLPQHKQWIEVKGVIGNNNFKISETFVKDTNQDLIIISSNEIYYFEDWKGEEGGCWMQEGMQVGNCSSCKTYFFTPTLGIWNCRKCGTHEGDHDIRAILENERSGVLNFSDVNSIKGWLESHAIKT